MGRLPEKLQLTELATYANQTKLFNMKCKKDNQYSITERTVSVLIPVLGSQPAYDVSHKPGGRLPLLFARPQLPSQPLRGLLPILLLGERKHEECEQFA